MVNVGIAGVLVAALFVVFSVVANEGKFDSTSLSADRLKALVGRPSEFVAQDISNGLYETRSGRAVFFVRGEVTNTGSASVAGEGARGDPRGRQPGARESRARRPGADAGGAAALSSPDELDRLLPARLCRRSR